MAVLSRLSPDRWGNHAHDDDCQRANAPELTPKHPKQRQTQAILPTAAPHRASLIPPRYGHHGRGSREVFSLQSALVVQGSSLSRALALSLEDTTEEQFQADLQRVLQESQSQSQSTPQPIPRTAVVDTPAKPNVFLSERAQLERERLARQKRLRGDTIDRNSSRGPTPSTSTADSEDYESDDNDLRKPAAKRQHLATPRQGRTLQRSKSNQSTNIINGSSKPSASSSATTNQPQMFWRGEIRQTANMHVDPKKDTKPTFRLSEIIGEVRPTILFLSQSLGLGRSAHESQQSDVAFAIISSYSTDYEFAYKMFSPITPVIIISHPATENREASMRFIQQNWIRITPKLLYNYSCMHMKVRPYAPPI